MVTCSYIRSNLYLFILVMQVLPSLQETQASHKEARFVEVARDTCVSLEAVLVQQILEEQT